MERSSARTAPLRSTSDAFSTWIARWSCVSTSPPIASTPERIASISASNCLDVCSFMNFLEGSARMLAARMRCPSAEATGDVILGFLALGTDEDLVGAAELDQLAEVHVGSIVGHPRRLLHVVGDDRDGVIGLELADQLLDLGR